jgi:hypothetical protein
MLPTMIEPMIKEIALLGEVGDRRLKRRRNDVRIDEVGGNESGQDRRGADPA